MAAQSEKAEPPMVSQAFGQIYMGNGGATGESAAPDGGQAFGQGDFGKARTPIELIGADFLTIFYCEIFDGSNSFKRVRRVMFEERNFSRAADVEILDAGIFEPIGIIGVSGRVGVYIFGIVLCKYKRLGAVLDYDCLQCAAILECIGVNIFYTGRNCD